MCLKAACPWKYINIMQKFEPKFKLFVCLFFPVWSFVKCWLFLFAHRLQKTRSWMFWKVFSSPTCPVPWPEVTRWPPSWSCPLVSVAWSTRTFLNAYIIFNLIWFIMLLTLDLIFIPLQSNKESGVHIRQQHRRGVAAESCGVQCTFQEIRSHEVRARQYTLPQAVRVRRKQITFDEALLSCLAPYHRLSLRALKAGLIRANAHYGENGH